MGDVRRPDVRVTMIDNDRTFVDSVVRYCELLDPPIVVTRLADLRTLSAYVARARPDVMTLDPDQHDDAVRLVTAICAAAPRTNVIALTMSRDSEVVARLAAAGALGWVGKDEPITAFVDAIDVVCNDVARFPDRYLGAVIRMIAARTRSARAANCPACALSKRETEVLGYMLTGVSARRVADQLHVSASTVRAHRRRIEAKLGLGVGVRPVIAVASE
jgi:DNA-binding NarL/FixJ family response regulator